MPSATPHSSICDTVKPTGSSVSRSALSLSGGALNMYSTGNSKSSFDSESLVCCVMKAYCAFMSLAGNPIIVSMTGMSVGIPISCVPLVAVVESTAT